jgi:hypothetical protein
VKGRTTLSSSSFCFLVLEWVHASCFFLPAAKKSVK